MGDAVTSESFWCENAWLDGEVVESVAVGIEAGRIIGHDRHGILDTVVRRPGADDASQLRDRLDGADDIG